MEDNYIKEAVDEAIDDVELIRQGNPPITVSVQDGVVTLAGVVMSGQMHRLALMAAATREGVVKVIDGLYEDRDLEIAVAGRLAEDPAIDALRPPILVSSYKGRVTLTGVIDSEEMAERALMVAAQTPGVLDVYSALKVIA
ncbi:MAG: BON domain-containing protein [Chloroflexi bacterium]|nr:BON domain-containing protein [Chloroflexota bacterium]